LRRPYYYSGFSGIVKDFFAKEEASLRRGGYQPPGGDRSKKTEGLGEFEQFPDSPKPSQKKQICCAGG
jgi:hypothetical protein